jgi:LuxR family maltose regulon positive regulatory protein
MRTPTGAVRNRHINPDERPGDVAELHRRASDWHARSGDPQAAVRHALAAGDADRAADLVERAIPDLRRRRGEAVIRRWIEDLPADVVDNRPVLAVGFIGALAAGNEFDDLERRLQDVERLVPALADCFQDRAETPLLEDLPGGDTARWRGCCPP